MSNKKIFTSMVRIKGCDIKEVIPVKSTDKIDKDLWLECSKALSRLRVGPSTKAGEVVCKNILNTGVDIIATQDVLHN